jgi:hypothetical protein
MRLPGRRAVHFSLEEVASLAHDRAAYLVAGDETLQRLELFDSRKSRVVELRFFGGLSIEKTAEVLKISQSLSCGSGTKLKPGCSGS